MLFFRTINLEAVIGAAAWHAPSVVSALSPCSGEPAEHIEAGLTPVPAPPHLSPLEVDVSGTAYGSAPLGEALDEVGLSLLEPAAIASQMEEQHLINYQGELVDVDQDSIGTRSPMGGIDQAMPEDADDDG